MYIYKFIYCCEPVVGSGALLWKTILCCEITTGSWPTEQQAAEDQQGHQRSKLAVRGMAWHGVIGDPTLVFLPSQWFDDKFPFVKWLMKSSTFSVSRFFFFRRRKIKWFYSCFEYSLIWLYLFVFYPFWVGYALYFNQWRPHFCSPLSSQYKWHWTSERGSLTRGQPSDFCETNGELHW